MTMKEVRNWSAPAAAALSLVACYGTLAVLVLLGPQDTCNRGKPVDE
jgi:hypothetical protein